jgi:transcriptional regulator with XRE-family HTH domain
MIVSMLAKASSHWRITARRDRIRRLSRERLGLTSDAEFARHIDMSASAVCLLLSGKTQPTAPVIALFVTTLEEPFEGLFAIERVVTARRELANAA